MYVYIDVNMYKYISIRFGSAKPNRTIFYRFVKLSNQTELLFIKKSKSNNKTWFNLVRFSGLNQRICTPNETCCY